MQLQRTSGDAVVNLLDAYCPFLDAKYCAHVSTNYGSGTKLNCHRYYVGMEGFRDYSYCLLTVILGNKYKLYPVSVTHHALNPTKNKTYVCCTEREYLETLETLLDSKATKKILDRIEATYHQHQNNNGV